MSARIGLRTWLTWLGAGLCAWLIGCAGGAPQIASSSATAPTADEQRAAKLAPDLYAQAKTAADEARAAEGATRDDLEAAAALWLAAAYREADRIELLTARRASEASTEAAEIARAELDRKRLAIEADIKLSQAARIARAEAMRMLEEAVQDERARPGRARDQAGARDEVATWLIARAQLTLASAIALGLPPPQSWSAETALRSATSAARGDARMQAARDALAAAERAMGLARAAAPAPTDAERASLLEMAAERKLMPVRDARGVVFDVSSAFTPGTSKLTRDGRAQLAHLEAIARAHPHGAIRVEALAQRSATAASQRARSARASVLGDALAQATTKERVQLAENPLPDASRIFVVFSAY